MVPDLGDQAVTLADASTEVEDGVLLLRFTRPLAAGRVAVDPLLPITHLWAVGSRGELSNHQVRVRVRVWVRVWVRVRVGVGVRVRVRVSLP